MHYKNNRAANEGDPIVLKGYDRVIAGTLHSISPGSTTCNGQVCYPAIGGTQNLSVTIGDCYHAEDALLAMESANDAAKLKTDSAS